MSKKVRLRFAPSPTGGLHLGGVRTVLYNYLFARHHGGSFILRIEDTDQARYVAGAEQYIIDCLEWCGLMPDEGPHRGGEFGPYRQSERKALGIYEKYAQQLVREGHAYYAFDTTEELDEMRIKYKTAENPSPQYNHVLRKKMRNSLNLLPEETEKLLAAGTPYVIRIRLEPDQEIRFTDMIRGEVSFNSSLLDDKVLLKADGMPTYHLAVVVDDHLMQISHAFRGEEWLPSAPVHILLWRMLFGEEHMPQWAHLPLILKPDGNGKLSKRDGDRLGFPVVAMNWTDPKTKEASTGFRETGFLPESFNNLLAMLGWNDGTGQEIFSLDELVEKFSIDRVHKGGAKFDFEKAKWFNHEWIKRMPVEGYAERVRELLEASSFNSGSAGITEADKRHQDRSNLQATSGGGSHSDDGWNDKFLKILELVKDRCTLLTDFVQQASFFFQAPVNPEVDTFRQKWNEAKQTFFSSLIRQYQAQGSWEAGELEKDFKERAAAAGIKPGDLLQPLRIMLVGGKFGPAVFEIAAILGRDETVRRIEYTLGLL